MAQTEDTELRDIVIEALEKNGSLAKIRALLRANIFLAFEDECENLRHNLSLDSVLQSPEGVAALCVVHDFLEFCNLKNTLFVYKSESRQARDYKYDSKALRSQLCLDRPDREPVLVALIKTAAKQSHNSYKDSELKHVEECGDGASKEDHNGSYIVHSGSGSPASPPSSDSARSVGAERTRLQLRLALDHSDTDSSSEGSRGRSAEYVPSQHAPPDRSAEYVPSQHAPPDPAPPRQGLSLPNYFTKMAANTSSDSTSYIDLKPFSSVDEKLLNTPGLPAPHTPPEHDTSSWKHMDLSESSKSATLSSVPSLSNKNDKQQDSALKQTAQELLKSDGEMAEYSYDFSASEDSKNNVNSDKKMPLNSPKHCGMEVNKLSPVASPLHNSHSSVSLSDVADLVSDRSSSFDKHSSEEKSPHKSNVQDKSPLEQCGRASGEVSSGEHSESPVPSLSNLSLHVHSD